MPELIDLINKQYQFDPIVLPEWYDVDKKAVASALKYEDKKVA